MPVQVFDLTRIYDETIVAQRRAASQYLEVLVLPRVDPREL